MNSLLKIIVLFIIIIVITSCKTVKPIPPTTYNDTLYQQFWTADWSPDNKYIAIGGVDSILRIYQSETLQLEISFPVNSWIHSVKWNPQGHLLAIATLDKYVQLIDVNNKNLIQLKAAGGSRAIGWNFDGNLLAVGELEGLIKIWDRMGNLIRSINKDYPADVAGKSFLSLDWHPTENHFITTNFEIQNIDTSGKILRSLIHPNPAAIMLCTQWHPSGNFFVIGDYGHNWEGENILSLLHFWTREGNLIRSVPGSKAEYRNLSWNKTGTQLATASDVLRIWSPDGKLLHEGSPDGTNYLWGIDWNNKGDKIVTASRHKTIAIWNNKAKQLVRIDLK